VNVKWSIEVVAGEEVALAVTVQLSGAGSTQNNIQRGCKIQVLLQQLI